MRVKKEKSGERQGILAFLVLYALITLIPACVYAAAGAGGKGTSPEAVSSGQEAASSEQKEPAAEPAPAQSGLPGFLDGVTPQAEKAPSEVPAEGDVFILYDQSTEETLEIPGKKLLPAAVACEMDLSSPPEALKAQAVACYTLFSRKRAAGEAIACDSSQWLVWTSEEAMRERWGEDYEGNLSALKEAIDPVYGQVLQWDGEPILAAYFAISSGSTETAGNVWEKDLPYLQAVASPGDAFSDGYLSSVRFTPEEFREAAAAAFTEDPPDLSGSEGDWLTDVEYTPSGYVSSAVLGGKKVSGTELRSAFSLRSACFQVEFVDGEFQFTVRGWGHGVGMSQTGAVFLAKRGMDYQAILAHYYPGASLT